MQRKDQPALLAVGAPMCEARAEDMRGPRLPESTASRVGFGADLASAAAALWRQPSVALVSLVAMLVVGATAMPVSEEPDVTARRVGWYRTAPIR